ncbi:gamma-mobile-trio protein GmtX [Pseudomonas vanderleydeniana]|uniref:Uncharacterized protein n=1 Tax=Pseudomonas vanderleydeniana TaxID=2745495 RepID=A0A9E6PG42_9PSED|nr:gamma-mobile-trio protein GmtX [Pseudomonas vanderleydeniana]QXI25881.1 hypothetical protein HU752_018105 [Pseudomonas vanderleydeniana]
MTTLPRLPEAQFADALCLVQSLKREAVRENKRKNLDLLWQVLEDLWQEGGRDYGVAEVGRKLTQAGGPKTQSLRNEGGRDFRQVIEAFAVCAGARGCARLIQSRSQLEAAVESLSDPAARAMFRQVVAENKLYKAQNDQLRSAFKALSISPPDDTAQSSAATPFMPASLPPLTTLELELLKKNLSPERFEENGWQLVGGGVVDDAGVVVLSPGFMEIMTKLFVSC